VATQPVSPLEIEDYTPLEDGSAREGFSLGYLVATIRRNLWLIAAIMAAAVAAAVAVTLLATPRYTATATVQVNEAADEVIGNEQDPNNVNVYDYDRFLQTQIDILNSQALAERVVNRLNLANDPQFFESAGVDIKEEATRVRPAKRVASEILHRSLSVDTPRNTRILPIHFTSTQPELAAKIANAYASELIDANLQRKFDSSAYARSFISDQLAEAKNRVQASEKALNDYARSTGLIRLTDPTADDDSKNGAATTSLTTASLAQVNQAAIAARAERIAAEARWNAVAHGGLLTSQPVLADPTVQGLMTRKAQAEADLAEERAHRLDSHPEVQAKRAELAQINRELNTAANNVRASIRSQYTTAAATENQLTGQVSALKGQTLSEQDSSVQYALLAREADTNRQLYEELLQRYKQLNASAGISASNIAIIDQAQTPVDPSSPKLLLNLAIALVLGAGLAALVTFLRSELDDSIRVPEDVEQKLGLPMLGVVPVEPDENIAAALSDPKTAISEAYSSLRGSLLYATPEGVPPTLLITSSQPAEGKSTTSRALAASFARVGKSVVLVDADIRRPSLHRFMGFENDKGITTVLTHQATIDDVVRTDVAPGYAVIAAGPVPPAPTELLASTRMQEVIDELAERYDLVILDTSPVLGLADAPTLSVLVDGVIFVVEAGKGRRGALKSSLRRLRDMRPNILGAVLTKFDPEDAANSYSSYYGYNYYEYRDSQSSAS
jgi:capsular exopolysaccharide synthesis family protein